MPDIGNVRTGRANVVMSAAAAEPDAGRTARVNANAVLAIVAVASSWSSWTPGTHPPCPLVEAGRGACTVGAAHGSKVTIL
jgi:hypothetical protein